MEGKRYFLNLFSVLFVTRLKSPWHGCHWNDFYWKSFHRPQWGIQAAAFLLEGNKTRVSLWQTLWCFQYLNWKFRGSSITAFQQLRSIQLLNWQISLCCPSVLEDFYKLQRSKKTGRSLHRKKKSYCGLTKLWFQFQSGSNRGLNLLLIHCVHLSVTLCSCRPTPTARRSGWLPSSLSRRTMSMRERGGCWQRPAAVPPLQGWGCEQGGEAQASWPRGIWDGRRSSFSCVAMGIDHVAPCHCLPGHAAALLQPVATQSRGTMGKKGQDQVKGFNWFFSHKWQKSGNSQFTAVCVMFVLHKSTSWKKEKMLSQKTHLCFY